MLNDVMNASFDPNQRIVAVSVGLSGPAWIGVDQPFYFNQIYLNTGNHYDASTGVFTCPTDGIYLFHMHARPANTERVCEVQLANIFQNVFKPYLSHTKELAVHVLVIMQTL